MIYGIGVDLVRIGRIEQSLSRWGERFVRRIYTLEEARLCSGRARPAAAFALRFAAKEAFSKAMGLGMRQGLKWREIEVFNEPGGKPGLRLHGTAARRCAQARVARTHLSLSDEGDYGVAMVVLETDAGGAAPGKRRRGKGEEMLIASDIMSTEVVTVKTETPLKELAHILYDRQINGVPVVDDDGNLIGVICESDLIRKNKKLHIPTVVTLFDAVFTLERPKKMEEELRRLSATTVSEIYTQDVFTVEERTPIEEIATLMSERRIYTIPVLDGGRLVGIIGKADLIRTLIT